LAVALNLFTVPPNVSFLDAIAAEWLRWAEGSTNPLAISAGMILLPTRRSARALAEAFLRQRNGRPMLLPRIAAVGALDEAPLTLTGALDLPPAIEPMQRLATLTRLILSLPAEGGAPRTADRAWRLAQELASLMDEAERAGIDLAERLPDAADPSFAEHWARTLQFLHIVTDVWPAWLAENGVMNPAARQAALLGAYAQRLEEAPPADPLLIAGITLGTPAVTRLLRIVSRLPNGKVVLPHLDLEMGDEAWASLEASHPQAGMARILQDLDAVREDVAIWPGAVADVPESRFSVLSRALLPAMALHDWMDDRGPTPVSGLSRLATADQQQEAQGIALVLRDALEIPNARVALVTPDRDLAQRVAAALQRFGIVVDDSAGERLADTPPAVFLRLLVRAVADGLAPVPLLALLKHPLAAAGLTPSACREAARLLEVRCLRGPRPAMGLAGLRLRVGSAEPPAITDFLARLEHCLEPALRFESAMAMPPAQALKAVLEAAERLAGTNAVSGASRLWGDEDGSALAELLSAAREAVDVLPDLRRGTLPGLLDAMLEGAVVRSRRALRGRGGVEHPRVFIWGLMEARLQSAELMVLGGLAEGAWPPVAEPGPWLSRPMRAKIGLPAPEIIVGQAAHDFQAACCSARDVVLSCPTRRDGAPAVPARWLVRLDMFLAGRAMTLPEHPASQWIKALDLPAGRPRPVQPPAPRPVIRLRPRSLSVTEVETWLRDPYAIYARRILRLRALAPLDEATDAADYGSIVHDGLHRFLRDHAATWPANGPAALRRAMREALAAAQLRPALQAWWSPRLDRIADWVAEIEAERRSLHPLDAIEAELSGAIDLMRPHGSFRLSGRADRIERYRDGSLAILDYKTGAPPAQSVVDAGLAPQLLLEALIAVESGFGPDLCGQASQLVYWHLSGGVDPGKVHLLFKGSSDTIIEAVAEARDRLCALIDDFNREERAYLAQPHPGLAPRFSDYTQLARVAEWSSAGHSDE
jgi:ATP-dependent helicase/nuclease subunit B